MGDTRPIPAHVIDFPQAMHAVSIAFQILQHYDWRGLHDLLSDRDGTLCFRDPTLFMAVRADPQWDAKLSLVEAAADFTGHVSDQLSAIPQRSEADHG